MPRPAGAAFVGDCHYGPRKSTRRGSEVGSYQSWWRSGRDSNSRTELPRLRHFQCDPKTGLVQPRRGRQLQFDVNGTSPALQVLPNGRLFRKYRRRHVGNAATWSRQRRRCSDLSQRERGRDRAALSRPAGDCAGTTVVPLGRKAIRPSILFWRHGSCTCRSISCSSRPT